MRVIVPSSHSKRKAQRITTRSSVDEDGTDARRAHRFRLCENPTLVRREIVATATGDRSDFPASKRPERKGLDGLDVRVLLDERDELLQRFGGGHAGISVRIGLRLRKLTDRY
jgi:hypothetical protein